MTRDDIIRLGFETNLFIYNGDDTSLTILLIPTEEKLLKFAALVAAAEREACAKICETGADCEHPTVKGHVMQNFGASTHLAEAIRARGET